MNSDEKRNVYYLLGWDFLQMAEDIEGNEYRYDGGLSDFDKGRAAGIREAKGYVSTLMEPLYRAKATVRRDQVDAVRAALEDHGLTDSVEFEEGPSE